MCVLFFELLFYENGLMVFGLKHRENFVSPMTIFRDFLFVVGACGCGCFSFLYLLFFFIHIGI